MEKREHLASRLGFILLSAGCAIGLGNVWRFPYITGAYGGAAFVLIYIVFLIIMGAPIMVMEFAIGRASKQNIGVAMKTLEPKGTKWHAYGHIAIAGNYILMMFYTTVTGWLLNYFTKFMVGGFAGMTPDQVGGEFGNMLSDPVIQAGFMMVAVLLGFGVVAIGLQKGVEKITKYMMSCLIVLIVALSIKSMLLPGAAEGLKFYLLPDFSKIADAGITTVLFEAMNQAFFTLSLGIGALTIFGSYIEKDHSLMSESVKVISLDTFVAFFSGLIIFPACSAFGVRADAGPSLLFITLPNIFSQMAGGGFWGGLFFLFMSFAALSTLIAVFENIVNYWMDAHGWTRKKSVCVNVIAMILLSMPCVLGPNILAKFQPLGPGTGVLDLEDFIVSTTLLPLGSLIFVLFCTSRYGWGWKNFITEADTGNGMKYPKWARVYISYILPIIVLVILLKGYWDKLAPLFMN